MADFLRDYGILLAFAGGSLSAYLVGLLISHLRREKRWLGYSIESRNIVTAENDDISVKFRGRDVKRLDSHIVTIRNIGNRPLANVPAKIVCDAAEIVTFELSAPDGAQMSGDLSSTSEIVVKCDLLDPGEVATVGLTVADSSEGSDIRFYARIEGLTVRKYNNQSPATELLGLFTESSPVVSLLFEVAASLTGGRGRR